MLWRWTYRPLAAHGVALELHLQNTLVVHRRGRLLGFIAHDLGGIRVHRERLRAAPSRWPSDVVLTRLHLRYEPGSLGDDLVLQAAPPIVGGRESIAADGRLSQAARPGGQNNFQARYAIRHAWPGPITCIDPERGVWRGPPDGRPPPPQAATDSAFVACDVALITFLAGDPPAPAAPDALPQAQPEPPPPSSARCDATPESSGWLVLWTLALVRRRRGLSLRAPPR